MHRSLPILLCVVVVSGCAGRSPYGCPLDAKEPHCRSLEEVYSEARVTPRGSVKKAATAGTLAYRAQTSVDNAAEGQPVFKQPQVFRPWLAPYVDADGNLRSGEYVYFSTPGEWNYGTTRETGAASAATLFGPQRPDQLGFIPVTPAGDKRATPASPNAPPAPPAVTTREGVTQPIETLTSR